IKACDDVSKARMETIPGKDYILLPLWDADPLFSQSSKSSPDARFKPLGDDEKKEDDANNTNNINIVSSTINAAGIEDNAVDENIVSGCADDPSMPKLEDIGKFSDAGDDD
ncbi:hypothetical protein Tco_0182039, partial [Tanacetum coccineum]